MIDVLSLVLVVITIGLIIFLFVKVYSVEAALNKNTLEIKSKIGSVIKEVNRVNEIKYKVDVNQQLDINRVSVV